MSGWGCRGWDHRPFEDLTLSLREPKRHFLLKHQGIRGSSRHFTPPLPATAAGFLAGSFYSHKETVSFPSQTESHYVCDAGQPPYYLVRTPAGAPHSPQTAQNRTQVSEMTGRGVAWQQVTLTAHARCPALHPHPLIGLQHH